MQPGSVKSCVAHFEITSSLKHISKARLSKRLKKGRIPRWLWTKTTIQFWEKLFLVYTEVSERKIRQCKWSTAFGENLLLNYGSFVDELSFWKHELLHYLVKDPLYLQPEKSAHTFISGEQWHLVSVLTNTEHSLGASLRLSLLLGLSLFFCYLNFTVPWISTACAAHLWQGLMNTNGKVAVSQNSEGVGWLRRGDLSTINKM